MKNLELQSLGLMELDAREMINLEGGNALRLFGILDAIDDFVDGFKAGWNEAKQARKK